MQELLEFWLRIQRGNEPDMLRFQDNIRKVAVLTQDVKQISVLLGVLVSEVRLFSAVELSITSHIS